MRFENTVALMGQEYVPSLAEWSEGRQRAALEDLGSYESAGRRGQRPFDESGAAGLQPSRKEGVLRRFIAGAAGNPMDRGPLGSRRILRLLVLHRFRWLLGWHLHSYGGYGVRDAS